MKAVSWPRLLVVGLSPGRPGFEFHVGNVGILALGQVSQNTDLLWLSPAIVIPPVPHTQYFIHIPSALHNPRN
jgi:hypothetical protein